MATKVFVLVILGACGAASPSPGDHDAAIDATGDDAPVDASPWPPQTTRLRIGNRCAEPIWIAHSDNVPFEQNQRLAPGEYHDYAIADGGLASARFWPKLGCDATGHACRIGDTGEGGGAPCGPTGCHPPVDSKFEVTFAATGGSAASPAGSRSDLPRSGTAAQPRPTEPRGSAATFYNLSLVDGYTLPFTVTPVGPGAGQGACSASDCSTLTLDACPIQEDHVGDLRLADIACLSPCKKWNYPAPYGLGRSESEDPGLHLCCPTPIDPGTGQCTAANGCMTPDACRAASDPLSVVHTDYVALIHGRCPTAYSYSYDDAAGLHACPAAAGFEVVFCP